MAALPAVSYDVTRLSDQDLYLFNEGTHYRLYQKLGAHPMAHDGVAGTYFAVWAPGAETSPSWATSTAGRPGASAAAARLVRHLGRLRPRRRPRRAVQVPHRLALPRLPRRQGRPVRFPRTRCRRAPPRWSGTWPITLGRQRLDGAARQAQHAYGHRCRSTRSISARGCASRKKATAG